MSKIVLSGGRAGVADYLAVLVGAYLGIYHSLNDNFGAAVMCIAWLLLLQGYLEAMSGWTTALKLLQRADALMDRQAAKAQP